MSAEEKLVKSAPTEQDQSLADPAFGWTKYAEQINGRFAMAGFVVLLVLEFFTKQDLITWLGLR
jgi:hypothetical protein